MQPGSAPWKNLRCALSPDPNRCQPRGANGDGHDIVRQRERPLGFFHQIARDGLPGRSMPETDVSGCRLAADFPKPQNQRVPSLGLLGAQQQDVRFADLEEDFRRG